MALKKCKECGNNISTHTVSCPACGAPNKKETYVRYLNAVILICLTLMVIRAVYLYTEYKNLKNELAEINEQTKIEAQQKQELEVFVKDIEKHYKKAMSLLEEGHYQEAEKTIQLFVKYKQLDYKDIRSASIHELEKQVAGISALKVRENLNVYKQLLALAPSNQKFKEKVVYYQSKLKGFDKKEAEQRYSEIFDLQLLSCDWSEENGYAIAKGQVKNISGRKIEYVKAVVTWYNDNGRMITSDSNLIEYTTLMPNQTSPFKVTVDYNRAMAKANVEFKYISGNRIKFTK